MTTYIKDGLWKVTDKLVRTPRKSFTLQSLDAVSLKRTPFLFAAPPSVGTMFLTALWWRYLYPAEIAFLLAASLISLSGAYQVGVLKLDALSLKDDEGGTVYGLYNQLVTIRDAIEAAMHDHQSKGGMS
jgi:hypothetical protein